MSSEEDGLRGEQWRALLEAEQGVARRRAEVNQLPSRVDLLAKALSSSSAWDRSAALEFLRLFPDDVAKLLDQLLDISLSPGWLLPARESIRAVRNEIDPALFARVAVKCLSDGEAEDYLRLADLLAELEAWQALSAVIGKAAESSDPEIREAARSLSASRGRGLARSADVKRALAGEHLTEETVQGFLERFSGFEDGVITSISFVLPRGDRPGRTLEVEIQALDRTAPPDAGPAGRIFGWRLVRISMGGMTEYRLAETLAYPLQVLSDGLGLGYVDGHFVLDLDPGPDEWSARSIYAVTNSWSKQYVVAGDCSFEVLDSPYI